MTTSMDFFARQEQARRNSGSLIFYFVLAGFGIVAMTCLIVAAVIVIILGTFPSLGDSWLARDFNQIMILTAVLTGGFITGLSLDRIRILRRGGGDALARLLGGSLIPVDTTDPTYRKVLNVVEETSIAAGIPAPPVYILEREEGINAFAAGYRPQTAVIGITKGAAELLDRDEIQGVIAHELSHVLYGDMRLNIRLVGLIHGVTVIGLAGRRMLLRSMGYGVVMARGLRSGHSFLPGVLGGLALMVVGSAGTLVGSLLKASICRQREYLADASAVQFTRNPAGIIGALKKMGGWAIGSQLESSNAEEVSHLFIGQVRGALFRRLFSTHPPLNERIRRIDPGWDGSFPVVDEETRRTLAMASRREVPGLMTLEEGFVLGAHAVGAAEQCRVESSAEPDAIADGVGALETGCLEYARQLIAKTPDSLISATRNPEAARCLVFALLLSHDENIRSGQLDDLLQLTDIRCIDQSAALFEAEGLRHPALRQLLLDMAIPALRRMPQERYAVFKEVVDTLIKADRRLDLSEWMIHRMLLRRIAPFFNASRDVPMYIEGFAPVIRHVETMLSCLAHAGRRIQDPDERRAAAEHAFARGADCLDLSAISLLPRELTGLKELDTALNRLEHLRPSCKKELLKAAAAVILADGFVSTAQGFVLRGVAEGLDLPMPPLLPGQDIPTTT
ncbi:M48 family metallopeptidase [Oceanidesulfovibrio marinus]|nr:M48 family metallopeptidase [Oceanidesulfovibrio marinus]